MRLTSQSVLHSPYRDGMGPQGRTHHPMKCWSYHHPITVMQVTSRERKVAGALERALELRDDLHSITARLDIPQRETTALPPLPNTRRLRHEAARTARAASRAHAEHIRDRKRRFDLPTCVVCPLWGGHGLLVAHPPFVSVSFLTISHSPELDFATGRRGRANGASITMRVTRCAPRRARRRIGSSSRSRCSEARRVFSDRREQSWERTR